jgi:DNA modification methylase
MIKPDDQSVLYCGDCRVEMQRLESESVQLAIFSPPYVDQRKSTYGGIPPDKYVDWVLPIASELQRVLKSTGTMIVNLKEKVVDGERHTYVIDLIKALRQQGWRHTEEYIWVKSNSMPGRWPNRFRDGWERLLQFNKQKHFAMYQESVMVHRSENTAKRVVKLSENDFQRMKSKTGSTFGKNMSHWLGREMVFPSNVLFMATETRNVGHSAAFPERLPEFFVKLFTSPGDLVLDPFCGSGTVGVVCKKLNRRFIGIEIVPEYVALAQKRIAAAS